MIDMSTGDVIFGDNDSKYTVVQDYNLLPELYFLLVRVMNEANQEEIFAIDLATKQVKWRSVIAEENHLKNANQFVGKLAGETVIPNNNLTPKVSATSIIYNLNNKLIALDQQTGSVKWNKKYDLSIFFLNESRTAVTYINKAKFAANSETNPLLIGKKMNSIDIETGDQMWEEDLKLDDTYRMHLTLEDDYFVVEVRQN